MQQIVGIEIQDKVDNSIGTKLKQFAKDSLTASANIDKLQESLNKVDSGKINELSNAAIRMRNAFKELNVASSQMTKDFNALARAQQINSKTAGAQAIAEQKLQQELGKTAVAQQKVALEANKSAVVRARANNEVARGATIAVQTAIAEQKLAQELAKTSIAQSKSAQTANVLSISQNKLVESSFKALTAEQQLAVKQQQVQASMSRAQVATTQAETAKQRLAVATNQAAVSANNLSLSNVRLVTGQQQLLTATNATALSMQRVSTETAKTSMVQARVNNEKARGVTISTQAAIAEQRLAIVQQQAATGAVRHERAILSLEQAQKRSLTTVRSLSYVVRDYLRVAMLASAVIFPAQSVLRYADTYVQLNNKLQIVSTSQAHANELMKELGEISVRTRGNLESTVTAFARFDRALQPYGTSQKEVLEMTETVNKALIVSGSTAQESASALLQLSQAFNAGKLQGDEFRAVSENLPIVMKYIAQALDSPITKLQDLRTKGMITSEVMLKAFKLMKDEVDETFLKTVPTMGQAMNVFRTELTIAMGEVEKSTGILRGLASAVIWVSEHLRELAVAAAATGAALMVMMGPQLVAAINVASVAMLKFTMLLLTNPVILFAAAIAGLVTAFVIFKDSTKMSADSVATWGDFADQAATQASGAWGEFFDSFEQGSTQTESLASSMFSNMGESVSEFVGTQIKSLRGFYSEVEMTPASIAMAIAKTMDAVVVFTMTTIDVIVIAFKRVGEDIMDVGVMVGRGLWTMAESFANAFIDFFNGFLMMLNIVATEISKLTPGVATVQPGSMLLDKVSFESNKPELPDREPRGDLQQTWDEAYAKRYNTAMQDYVANTVAATEAAAKLRAEQAEATKTTSNLRGETENLTKSASENAGRTAKQADSLAKVIAQLDDEIARMNMIKPLREEQARFDKIREKMIGKGLKLTESEITMLKQKINVLEQAKKMQVEMDRIYDEAIGPIEKYNATIAATNQLLQQQIITQQQAAAEMSKARVEMFNNSPSNEQMGMNVLSGMGIDVSDSDMGIAARLQQLQFYYEEVERLRQEDVISEQAANHAKADLEMKMLQTRSAQYKNFFDGLAQLQNSNIKELAHIGKAAAITQAVINTYEGATKALAQGGIYGAAMAAVVVANGLAQVANIRAQQTGFEKGGYTGNIGRKTVAGVVHGNEFVMDADATSRIGVGNLEALRSGAMSLNENSDNRTSNTTVVNNNSYTKTEGEGKQAKVSVINVLDPSLLSDYVNSPEGEQQIVNIMYRNQQSLQG